MSNSSILEPDVVPYEELNVADTLHTDRETSTKTSDLLRFPEEFWSNNTTSTLTKPYKERSNTYIEDLIEDDFYDDDEDVNVPFTPKRTYSIKVHITKIDKNHFPISI